MQVRNEHERVLAARVDAVAALVDSLASRNDKLWPRDSWPAMRLDRALTVGAVGGHGPIRYTVEAYEHGRSVRFRFTAPAGFSGTHGYEVQPLGDGNTLLRHVLEMHTSGAALVSWPLVYRPLHDALIEDSLDLAELNLGLTYEPSSWSPTVRILRWILTFTTRCSVRGSRRHPRPGRR
jgi:hypothetical protein